jgi:predicted DCC family thiol-disulfide oxidoreductase YuxK
MSELTYRLLYDAECRFCRWSGAWVLRADRARRLEPVALQDPVALELLRSMNAEERMASWHLVGPDGVVRSGAAAAAPLLRLLPGGRVPARSAELAPGVVEWTYGRVVDLRGELGRLLSDRAIARADRLIASRRRP